MWFSPKTVSAWKDAIRPGIEDSGYVPFRIDEKEHNRKIDDEIIAEIRRSRFIVADFTGHRGGVYFEAGFAMGLGIPIIWTREKGDIQNLHFDIRQYNCIDWEATDELRTRLYRRIVAMLGVGPRSGEAQS